MSDPAKKTTLQKIALGVSIFLLALLGSVREHSATSHQGRTTQAVANIGNSHSSPALRRISGERTPATTVDHHRGSDGRSPPSDHLAAGLASLRIDDELACCRSRTVVGFVFTALQLPQSATVLDAPRARAPPRVVA